MRIGSLQLVGYCPQRWIFGLRKPDASPAPVFGDELDARGFEGNTYRLQCRRIPWAPSLNPGNRSGRDIGSTCQISDTPLQSSPRHSDLIGSQHYNLDIISG